MLRTQVPTLTIEAHSPLDVLLTDPAGRRTGVSANKVLAEIPQGSYQIPFGEEEESGIVIEDPEGAKTIIVSTPLPGTYDVQLRGTNTGIFTLVLTHTDSEENILYSQTTTGTIHPEELLYYSTTNLTSQPVLEIMNQPDGWKAISVFGSPEWSYRLEASSNLSTWQPILTNLSTKGFFSLEEPSTAETRFYRAARHEPRNPQ